jgi:hypothetical protein
MSEITKIAVVFADSRMCVNDGFVSCNVVGREFVFRC